MIIIDVQGEESIERALKKYKRKIQRTQILKELRDRKQFTKPSVRRRKEVLNAIYKERKYGNDADE